ncbi:MAG: hypothetical protein AAGD01_02360 [Acidobacteriota bacterium]
MTGRNPSPTIPSSERSSSQRITRHPLPPGVNRDAALLALRETAESWGATFEAAQSREAGGQLGMPAAAGMRMGWLEGHVGFDDVREEDRKAAKEQALGRRYSQGAADNAAKEGRFGRECLVFTQEKEHWQVRRPAVMMLSLAAVGSLFTLVGPFVAAVWPELMGLLPLAVLLALGGWFLVISQLTVSGPEDFLRAVAEVALEEHGSSQNALPESDTSE